MVRWQRLTQRGSAIYRENPGANTPTPHPPSPSPNSPAIARAADADTGTGRWLPLAGRRLRPAGPRRRRRAALPRRRRHRVRPPPLAPPPPARLGTMGCRRSGSAQHRCLRLTAGRSRGGDAPARPAAAAPAAARGAGPNTADAVSPPPCGSGRWGAGAQRWVGGATGAAVRPRAPLPLPLPRSRPRGSGRWGTGDKRWARRQVNISGAELRSFVSFFLSSLLPRH